MKVAKYNFAMISFDGDLYTSHITYFRYISPFHRQLFDLENCGQGHRGQTIEIFTKTMFDMI